MKITEHIQGDRILQVEYGIKKSSGGGSYFSITAALFDDQGKLEKCGAIHDEIEQFAPGVYTDLIALHLADVDGVPMHAEEIAWWYAGGTEWEDPSLDKLRRHLRLVVGDYKDEDLLDKLMAATEGEEGDTEGFRQMIDSLRPRWKEEADAAISRWQLI